MFRLLLLVVSFQVQSCSFPDQYTLPSAIVITTSQMSPPQVRMRSILVKKYLRKHCQHGKVKPGLASYVVCSSMLRRKLTLLLFVKVSANLKSLVAKM